MRWNRQLTMGAALALLLTGCPGGEGEQGGGGGDDTPAVTYDRSNPVTRQQEGSKGAVPLQPVAGGEPVSQPREGIENARTQVIARGGQAQLKVNVNTATQQELMRVPGIGQNLAQAIVSYRRSGPYTGPEDLANRLPNVDERLVDSFDQYLTF